MECSHLEDAVDISPTFVKKLLEENRNLWSCAECQSNKSPWMCLKCGLVLCGRYVNGHCKDHGESKENHFVVVDTNLVVFCYKCDDFVINDTSTGNIQLIRTALEAEVPRFRQQKRRKRSVDQQIVAESPSKKAKSASKENLYSGFAKTVRTVGLRNLGNTCFMNAILQSLSNLKDFSCYFKELPAFKSSEKENLYIRRYYTRSYQSNDISLVEELRKVLCALWQGSSMAISPDSLFSVVWKVVPRFRGFQQHDAHEFMLYLLNHCHAELLKSKSYSDGRDTIVSGIFGGELLSEVSCLKCGTVSKKKETCLDLSLDIPLKPKTQKSQKTKEKPKVSYLTECLQRFVEVEDLDKSDWYSCHNCKKKQASTKKFWLSRLPNVLCLHLKRFRYSPNGNGRTKVDTFVRFPIKELDMNPYLLKSSEAHRYSTKAHIYDLAAVVVHHGSGAGSGHYTTYARHEGSWYHFNDSTVTRIVEDAIIHCKGYILFYTRQYPDINVIGRIKSGIK